MSTILTLCASAIFLIAWAMYNKDLIKGKAQPSIVGWAVFSFITIINSVSYLAMSGNWVKTVVAFTDCFVCWATFIAISIKARPKIKDVDFWDWMALAAGTMAIIAWIICHQQGMSSSATAANLIVQSGYFFGMIPTARNAAQPGAREPILPWFIWASAFILSLIVVYLEWTNNWWELLNPAVCLIEHAGVGFIALHNRETT